jgi:hypothetical protein
MTLASAANVVVDVIVPPATDEPECALVYLVLCERVTWACGAQGKDGQPGGVCGLAGG